MQLRKATRWFVAFLVAVSVPTVGIAAAAGKSPDVQPGKGCGDDNHDHYKEGECKKSH